MSNVTLPIETFREGNKITKICVEDIYKIINRVYESMDSSYNKSSDILDEVFKTYENSDGKTFQGEMIIGKGVSQPCITDVFDEEIGNNIAFIKAKLNANIKKHNILVRVYNEWLKALETLDNELDKIDDYIRLDLHSMRTYNPSYLPRIENELGI